MLESERSERCDWTVDLVLSRNNPLCSDFTVEIVDAVNMVGTVALLFTVEIVEAVNMVGTVDVVNMVGTVDGAIADDADEGVGLAMSSLSESEPPYEPGFPNASGAVSALIL